MGEPPGVIVPALKNHRHQANLTERIELHPRTACGHSFTALDEAKRHDFLLFAVVEYLEIFRLEVVNGVPFLVANHDIQQDFLAGCPHSGALRRCSCVLLGVTSRQKKQRDCREPKAHESWRIFHCSFPFPKILIVESL